MNASSTPNSHSSANTVADIHHQIQHAISTSGVALYIRQSTIVQSRRNLGSKEHQRAQLGHLRYYDVPPERVHVIEATESANIGGVRPGFSYLIRLIETRAVRLILFSAIDRSARNDQDFTRLINLCEQYQCLIMVDGKPYNPANSAERLLLEMQGSFAAFENRHRTLRNMTAKFANAQHLRLPRRVPSPFVWASPDDEAYAYQMRLAGLQDLITPEALAVHRVTFSRQGKSYFILPYPDADALRTVALRFAWFFETESIGKVIRLIGTHPDWPAAYHGTVPVLTRSHYDPQLQLVWRLIGRDVANGRQGVGRSVLYNWLLNPILHGIYTYQSPVLSRSGTAVLDRTEVFEPNAIPMEGRSLETWQRTKRITHTSLRRRCVSTYDGPRGHAIPVLRCAALRKDGSECGRRVAMRYYPDGTYAYVPGCKSPTHTGHISGPRLDRVVYAILASAFGPSVIEAVLRSADIDRRADGMKLGTLRERLSDLQSQLAFAEKQSHRFFQIRDQREEEKWQRRADQARQSLYEVEEEIKQTAADVTDEAMFVDQDCTAILRIAHHFDELLTLCRDRSDSTVRQLTEILVKAVRVWPVGWQSNWVEIEFPTGVRVGRLVPPAPPLVVGQPLAIFIGYRLACWTNIRTLQAQQEQATHAATILLVELNELSAASGRRWTVPTLWTIAYMATFEGHRFQRPSRDTAPHSINEIAIMVNETRIHVLRQILAEQLGPAYTDDHGIYVRPTAHELASAFPEYARRRVADAKGWDLADTVSIGDAIRRGVSRSAVLLLCHFDDEVGRDDAGLLYVRQSVLMQRNRGLLQKALAMGPPEYRALDRRYWQTPHDVKFHYGNMDVQALRGKHPVLPMGNGKKVFVWLPPQLSTQQELPLLTQVVQMLNRSDVQVQDFLPPAQGRHRINKSHRDCRKDALLTRAGYEHLVKEGVLFQCVARSEVTNRHRTYLYAPQWIFAGGRSMIEAWLAGKLGRGLDLQQPRAIRRRKQT